MYRDVKIPSVSVTRLSIRAPHWGIAIKVGRVFDMVFERRVMSIQFV